MRGEATCAVTIPVRAPVVYGFWADVASYPRWLEHLERVDVFDERHSRWSMVLPQGTALTWETEITLQRPYTDWAWSSTAGDVVTFGHARLEDLGDNRTRMRVRRFHGASRDERHLIEPWLKDPDKRLRRDLERLVDHIRSNVIKRPVEGFALDFRGRPGQRGAGTRA